MWHIFNCINHRSIISCLDISTTIWWKSHWSGKTVLVTIFSTNAFRGTSPYKKKEKLNQAKNLFWWVIYYPRQIDFLRLWLLELKIVAMNKTWIQSMNYPSCIIRTNKSILYAISIFRSSLFCHCAFCAEKGVSTK